MEEMVACVVLVNGGDGSWCGDLGECRDILRIVHVESGRIPSLLYSGKLSRKKTFVN